MESELEREQIIRSEATEFAVETISETIRAYQGQKKFRDQLVSELRSIYEPDDKIIYLDQVILEVHKHWQTHQATCPETKLGKKCPMDETYQKMLFYVSQEIDALPHYLRTNKNSSKVQRDRVFISYSHRDQEWLEKFRRHFRPFEGQIDFWDDQKIGAGMAWKEEIMAAIGRTRIAVLLISADFFNSDFIMKHELSPLLQAAKEDGATIVSVILKPCMFDEYEELSQYQAINSPNSTLIQMDEATQELTWVQLVKTIKKLITA